jgi:Trk-type K+ transport system membrane component
MNSNFGGGININNHTQILRILVFVLIISAIVVIVMLEYKKHKKSTNSCDSISKQYGSKDSIVINSNSGVKGLALKDVAIMGAPMSFICKFMCFKSMAKNGNTSTRF